MIIRDLSHRDYRMVGIIIFGLSNPSLVVVFHFLLQLYIHVQHSLF